MAGKVVVSTLNNDTGVLATQNGMTGIVKAWVNFNGTSGASPVIRQSFNVSSVTRNSTGNYTVNYTTAMPNADAAVFASCSPNFGVSAATITVYDADSGSYSASTSNARVFVRNSSFAAADVPAISVAVTSS